MNSVPIPLNKAAMRKYDDLEVPCESILGTYVWVDSSGIDLRSKDRTFDFVPAKPKDLPIWYYDGSNTGQATPDNADTFIFPEKIYHDPFRRSSHILVLSDTYQYDYQPTASNRRKGCLLSCEKSEVEEPWFGFNQEFFLTTPDNRPLGWPPGGFPSPPGPYYCAIGANKIVARDLMEAFYRCCLYAGVGVNGINPGTTPSQWNFQELVDMILLYGECSGNGNAALRLYAERFPARRQPNHGRVIVNTLIRLRNNNPPVPINRGGAPQLHVREVGPSPGIRSADDLWMARYILSRLAEEYGTVACFDPQPIPDWPGNGTFCYFSTKDMREEDGILVIERAIDKLARRHGVHINEYDAHNGADNVKRLTGLFNNSHIKDFTAGVANRSCSVRIPRQVAEDKRGYLEDRRPAANVDPYRVISVMLKTCIFDE